MSDQPRHSAGLLDNVGTCPQQQEHSAHQKRQGGNIGSSARLIYPALVRVLALHVDAGLPKIAGSAPDAPPQGLVPAARWQPCARASVWFQEQDSVVSHGYDSRAACSEVSCIVRIQHDCPLTVPGTSCRLRPASHTLHHRAARHHAWSVFLQSPGLK